MLSSKDFIEKLREKDFSFFTGVPCSLLSGLISELDKNAEVDYMAAVREDSAVGVCAGMYMGGRLPVLLMQNSGLGYSLNAFTSLNLIYNIPTLVIMSWRGFEGKDAPEHIIMGDVCEQFLDSAGMEYSILTDDNVDEVLTTACNKIKNEALPYTLLVKKGLFDERH